MRRWAILALLAFGLDGVPPEDRDDWQCGDAAASDDCAHRGRDPGTIQDRDARGGMHRNAHPRQDKK